MLFAVLVQSIRISLCQNILTCASPKIFQGNPAVLSFHFTHILFELVPRDLVLRFAAAPGEK